MTFRFSSLRPRTSVHPIAHPSSVVPPIGAHVMALGVPGLKNHFRVFFPFFFHERFRSIADNLFFDRRPSSSFCQRALPSLTLPPGEYDDRVSRFGRYFLLFLFDEIKGCPRVPNTVFPALSAAQSRRTRPVLLTHTLTEVRRNQRASFLTFCVSLSRLFCFEPLPWKAAIRARPIFSGRCWCLRAVVFSASFFVTGF